MRVAVWSGDGKTYLGEGEYLEDVPVWYAQMPDGDLLSVINPEEPPSLQVLAEFTNAGGKILVWNMPKITLDSGKVVYGCQVWWKEIDNSDSQHNPTPE